MGFLYSIFGRLDLFLNTYTKLDIHMYSHSHTGTLVLLNFHFMLFIEFIILFYFILLNFIGTTFLVVDHHYKIIHIIIWYYYTGNHKMLGSCIIAAGLKMVLPCIRFGQLLMMRPAECNITGIGRINYYEYFWWYKFGAVLYRHYTTVGQSIQNGFTCWYSVWTINAP